MSFKVLEKALKNAMKDEFEVGTVIRWMASGTYDYAALKAGDGKWYTTAREFNSYVMQTYSFEGLVKVLQKSETSDVCVSSAWYSVGV